jgi:hypothetical protein
MSKTKTLKILNGLCMVVQGGFCGLWIAKKRDNYIIPQDLKVYTTSIQNINGTIKTVIKEKENSFIKKDLRDLLIAFFGITAAVHAFYFFSGGIYDKMIANQNNYIRWIEYSITATLMINIVARSAGVSDEDTLILCNLATVAVMLQGQTIELALKENPSSTKLQQLIIYNLVGWGLMIGVFAIIISKFQQTIDEIKAATCAKIPDFVNYIIYSQAAFYMSFGLLQFIQILTVYNTPNYDYANFEIGYNVLSLLSKTTLGFILGFGIDQSSGRDNGQTYPSDCSTATE